MTKKSQNNTSVFMSADFSFLLGNLELCPRIPRATALQVMDAIDTCDAPERSCLQRLSAIYNNKVRFSPSGIKFNKSQLILDFDHYDRLPCFNESDKITQRGRTQKCTENIRSGKCTDKYVRDTIGAILFPQLYAKQTEHQK